MGQHGRQLRTCKRTGRLDIWTHLDLPGIIKHADDAKVIGEEVDRVVAGDGDADLELAGQELGAVDGLRGVLKVCAKPVEVAVCSNLGVLCVRGKI